MNGIGCLFDEEGYLYYDGNFLDGKFHGFGKKFLPDG
jgi:hypothetical protein